MLEVIKNKNWFLGFSGVLIIASFVVIGIFGFKQGIDLHGGTSWRFNISDESASSDVVKEVISSVEQFPELNVRQGEGGSFVIRMPNINEEMHERLLFALESKFTGVKEDSFSSIGPAIGSELRRKSIWAIIFVLFAISAYIAWAFRKVSEPVRSWKYGVVTLITLLHDVIIPSGLMALLGHFKGVEIDTNFIVALLVVMGFSVHDTIVVFDRIRENLFLAKGSNRELGGIIDISIKETVARSINTSLTLVIVLFVLLLAGPASLFYFVLTMLVGTVFGTYSSIFVASPLLYLSQRRKISG